MGNNFFWKWGAITKKCETIVTKWELRNEMKMISDNICKLLNSSFQMRENVEQEVR